MARRITERESRSSSGDSLPRTEEIEELIDMRHRKPDADIRPHRPSNAAPMFAPIAELVASSATLPALDAVEWVEEGRSLDALIAG